MSYRWQFSGSFDAKSNELVIVASGPGPAGQTTKHSMATVADHSKLEIALALIYIAEAVF